MKLVKESFKDFISDIKSDITGIYGGLREGDIVSISYHAFRHPIHYGIYQSVSKKMADEAKERDIKAHSKAIKNERGVVIHNNKRDKFVTIKFKDDFIYVVDRMYVIKDKNQTPI